MKLEFFGIAFLSLLSAYNSAAAIPEMNCSSTPIVFDQHGDPKKLPAQTIPLSFKENPQSNDHRFESHFVMDLGKKANDFVVIASVIVSDTGVFTVMARAQQRIPGHHLVRGELVHTTTLVGPLVTTTSDSMRLVFRNPNVFLDLLKENFNMTTETLLAKAAGSKGPTTHRGNDVIYLMSSFLVEVQLECWKTN